MISLLTGSLEDIAKISERYDVRRLEVFGSAVSGNWNPETSDVDLVVDFGDYVSGDTWRFVDFARDLELLLKCPVQLVTYKAIWNPFFKAEVDETKVLLYESPNGQVAA